MARRRKSRLQKNVGATLGVGITSTFGAGGAWRGAGTAVVLAKKGYPGRAYGKKERGPKFGNFKNLGY